MRSLLSLVFACLVCHGSAHRRPPAPRESSLRAGMQLAKTRIIERLRGCLKLPELMPSDVLSKGARQLSMDQTGRVELFELELQYDNRNYFVQVKRERGEPWTIQGSIVPDPCEDDMLAVTQDDVDALNAQGLTWTAALSSAVIGKTVRELGLSFVGLPTGGETTTEETTTGETGETGETTTGETTTGETPNATAGDTTPDETTTNGEATTSVEPTDEQTTTFGDAMTTPPPPPHRRAFVVGGVSYPDNYDATERYLGDYPCKAFAPRGQGSCGTCTHFAASSTFAARLCMNNGRTSNTNILISPRQISDCAIVNYSSCSPNGYGYTWANLDYYAQMPARAREDWCLPYQQSVDTCDTDGCPLSRTFPITGVKGMTSVASMQTELIRNGPFIVAIMAHNSLFAYSSGVYTLPTTIPPNSWVGGHAMMLVGWGVDNITGVPYWRIQNSWGSTWGDDGYLKIRRGTNECEVETRDVKSFVPGPSLDCPNSPCANGSITLADCTCQCVGPIMGGALCDTVVNSCQNGGRLERWKRWCVCPTGMYGPLCQYGFQVASVDTVTCSGATKYVRIPYVIDVALDYRSTIALYSLTQTSPFSSLASARICSAPGPCPLSGNVTLTISSTLAIGRYRIIMAPATSTGAMYNFNEDTLVTAYYTNLNKTGCTTAVKNAALPLNAKDVPIVAAEAAELDAVARAKPRLDEAAATRAAMDAQGPAWITYNDAPLDQQGDIWVTTPSKICFYVPPYMNQEKKNKVFEVRIGGAVHSVFASQFPAIDFVANPSAVSPNAACFTAGIPAKGAGMYQIVMLTADGAEYVRTPPFNTQYIEMFRPTGPTTNGALKVIFTLSWNIKVGTPMANDVIKVRSRDGNNSAVPVTLSTAANLKQLGTFQTTLFKLPVGQTQGPYAMYYHRGNATVPTAWNLIYGITWANYRL